MTSDRVEGQAYVWIWLPEATEPVVAGLLTRQDDGRFTFNYGRSYLGRDDAIAIDEPELPLRPAAIETPQRMQMPGAIRDGSPDAWGRRVIINRITGLKGKQADTVELDEVTYLLESGSDRIGALDFQSSPSEYVPRQKRTRRLRNSCNPRSALRTACRFRLILIRRYNTAQRLAARGPKR